MLFLALGLYLLFSACDTYLQVHIEKSEPYEVSAVISKEQIDLNALLQIEGVKKASPVIRLDAEILSETYSLHCEVKAVFSSFPDLKLVEGCLFPDDSNMPFLVLNKAASKAFSMDGDATMTVSANTEVLLKENAIERKAIICGIFDDDSKIPAAYMSYDTAKQEFPQSGSAELLLSLAHKGACKKVVNAIQRLGLFASFDENGSMRMELMTQQVWLLLLTSIGFMACAAILIVKNRSEERVKQKGEITALLISGLLGKETMAIYPLRIVLTEIICLAFSTATAGITGKLSWFSFFVCAVMSLIHVALISSGDSLWKYRN